MADVVVGEVVRLAQRINPVEASDSLSEYLASLEQRPARIRVQAALS